MTIVAKDYDLGDNGTVIYSLGRDIPSETGTGRHLFTIEEETGLLKSNTDQLDRESVDSYNLLVVATDKGVEPKSATATVTVIIDDENDQVNVKP